MRLPFQDILGSGGLNGHKGDEEGEQPEGSYVDEELPVRRVANSYREISFPPD